MRSDLWQRDQLILALNLYWKIPYNKISGSSNEEIKKLAKIIGKTPAALAFMLMNFTALDIERQDDGKKGKRPPGELATKLWFEYLNNWEKLADDSFEILQKINTKAVTEILNRNDEYENNEGFEKYRTVKSRINQRDFRLRILAAYNTKCCITNIDIPSLLVASHIIPWSKNVQERLNPRNGLCLNAVHDRAFDNGLITITPDFKIKLSEDIFSKKKDVTIQEYFLKYDNTKITLPDRFTPSIEFLEYHNNIIFEKWLK